MSITRKMLKGMGLTEDQQDTILEAHTETVNEIKAERDRLKADAEKLPGVQKELDDLKAAGDDGFEAKYNAEKKAFADYKAEITAKETKAAKEKAVRAYFESKNIEGANLNIAMRSSGAEIDAVELENGKIKDTAALDALVSGDYAGLVSQPSVRVDMGARLNNNGKPMTKEEITAIKESELPHGSSDSSVPSIFTSGGRKCAAYSAAASATRAGRGTASASRSGTAAGSPGNPS